MLYFHKQQIHKSDVQIRYTHYLFFAVMSLKKTPETLSVDTKRAIQLAGETIAIEAEALATLKARLENEDAENFTQAVLLLLKCNGRIVVSGIGKSGHIARKIAATLASTGTPAMFVHPAEAVHGDLGMITQQDVFIAISYSGEAEELLAISPIIKRMGAWLIAFTGNTQSNLAKLANIHLSIQVEKEACPLNLAPTASTTASLALGDALAVAVLDARGFRENDFARSHPGGVLGRRLLTLVSDIMRSGNDIPIVYAHTLLHDALFEITKKGMAMTAVVDNEKKAIGIFTDGDLRRLIETTQNFSKIMISDVMTKNPRSITPDKLAVEAMHIMEQYRINQLLVSDNEGKLVGAIHIHDLTQAKII